MNDTAKRILAQATTRRLLLNSILPDALGQFVLMDKATGLCHASVDDARALVPVEHGTRYQQKHFWKERMRGTEWSVEAVAEMVPLGTAIEEALQDLGTLEAWVRECG